MKKTTTLLALTALTVAAGCNRGATNNAGASNSAAANTAAPAAPAPAAAGGVDQAFVTGHWGATPDCARTISFNADGTATNSGDAEVARWTLQGNTLTVTPPGEGPQPGTVARSGDNLVLSDPGGQTMTLIRCAAAGAAAPAGSPAGAPEESSE